MAKFYMAKGVAEETLANGRPWTGGEVVDLSADDQKDPHNKRLIDEGKLLKAGKEKS